MCTLLTVPAIMVPARSPPVNWSVPPAPFMKPAKFTVPNNLKLSAWLFPVSVSMPEKLPVRPVMVPVLFVPVTSQLLLARLPAMISSAPVLLPSIEPAKSMLSSRVKVSLFVPPWSVVKLMRFPDKALNCNFIASCHLPPAWNRVPAGMHYRFWVSLSASSGVNQLSGRTPLKMKSETV